MRFSGTPLPGVWLIEPEPAADGRGFFARIYCRDEMSQRGLHVDFAQQSISFSHTRGTLRGMHFQSAPFEETKLFRCTMGAVHDVLVDLRPQSLTFKRWFAVELSAENRKMLYVPPGLAHGFQTLADATEMHYQISPAYRPEAAAGVRWNDPAFQIEWPLPPANMSERDLGFPDFAA
jgi:dTDP-4-dehydrorhamnose 3,5-epimerase